jgi:hypothetical protein
MLTYARHGLPQTAYSPVFSPDDTGLYFGTQVYWLYWYKSTNTDAALTIPAYTSILKCTGFTGKKYKH